METENDQRSYKQPVSRCENGGQKAVLIGLAGALLGGAIVYLLLSGSALQTENQLNGQISALQDQMNALRQTKSTVKSSDVTVSAPTEHQTPLTQIKDDGRLVSYQGSITVSGRYQEIYSNSPIEGQLCFFPDSETAHLIPREVNAQDSGKSDDRIAWFCFKNQDEAKKIFGINDADIFDDKKIECIEGKATVQVSNYIVDKLEGDVFDTANLDKVVSKENYSTQCD